MLPVLAGAGGDSWGGLLGLPGPRWRPQFELSTPRSEARGSRGKGRPRTVDRLGSLDPLSSDPPGPGGLFTPP